MFLLTKKNVSEDVLAKLVGQTIMFDTKFGIKIIHVETATVSPRLENGRDDNGYLFRRCQGPYLLRSDNHDLILHGTTEDMIRFIKTEDYSLDDVEEG